MKLRTQNIVALLPVFLGMTCIIGLSRYTAEMQEIRWGLSEEIAAYATSIAEFLSGDAYRDMVMQWSKDLGRSLDYLEGRPDIDSERLAYYGLSFGASLGLILTALEDRFGASVFVAGGLDSSRPPREVDKFHFLPRIRTPTLMLAGRIDFIYPVETSLEPMYRLLGTPEKDKKLVLFDSGHIVPRLPMIKEILDWLDHYLGPVQRTREVPARELEEATSPVRETVRD